VDGSLPNRRTSIIPNLITRRMIEGAGHFLPREKPQAVSGALLEVLAASA
jgi:pimeloyl-ACP methyl ester carboxylesterase